MNQQHSKIKSQINILLLNNSTINITITLTMQAFIHQFHPLK